MIRTRMIQIRIPLIRTIRIRTIRIRTIRTRRNREQEVMGMTIRLQALTAETMRRSCLLMKTKQHRQETMRTVCRMLLESLRQELPQQGQLYTDAG